MGFIPVYFRFNRRPAGQKANHCDSLFLTPILAAVMVAQSLQLTNAIPSAIVSRFVIKPTTSQFIQTLYIIDAWERCGLNSLKSAKKIGRASCRERV